MNPDDTRAPRSARQVGVWMAVIVIAAVLPVLAQTSLLSRVSTLLWLASMPLCILGCAMLAKELAARRASRHAEDGAPDSGEPQTQTDGADEESLIRPVSRLLAAVSLSAGLRAGQATTAQHERDTAAGQEQQGDASQEERLGSGQGQTGHSLLGACGG